METPPANTKDLRNFGLITGIIMVALFGLLLPWIRGGRFPTWPFVIGAILSVLAIAVPNALGPVHRIWMWVGGVLGWLNTRIVLGVVFLLVITPVALIMRVIGRDVLQRKFESGARSYKVPSVPHSSNKMEVPF